MTSLQFVGQWYPLMAVAGAALLGCLAWWLAWREVSPLALGSAKWMLPTLRAGAIFLIVVTLAEPVIESRYTEGEPGKIVFVLDDSRSMSVVDEPHRETSRLERAVTQLVDPQDGILPRLSSGFEMMVLSSGGEDGSSVATSAEASLVRLWESSASAAQQPLPKDASDWLPENWTLQSPLGEMLAAALSAVTGESAASAQPVVVLLTDGQSNSGESPLAVVEEFVAAKSPVFVVGYGSTTEPPDVAVTAIEAPERLYRTDTLSGQLVVADRLPSGSAFNAEILQNGVVVWEQEFVTTGTEHRQLPFSIDVAPLVEAELKQLPTDVNYATVPLKLEARLTTSVGEANTYNNRRAVHIDVTSQKARVLLVDGRSRWETRYLHNLFQRDPAWEIDLVLESSLAAGQDESTELKRLPQSRAALFEYNLIILGDTPSRLWQAEQLTWLAGFVERGGGLIFIDGTRGHLRESAYGVIAPLLPIRWSTSGTTTAQGGLPAHIDLSPAGRTLAALELTSEGEQDNVQLWKELPPLQVVSDVQPLPGSEVLIEAVTDLGKQPLMASRRFGAGRVVYFASDETWRWRYKVADLVHQRVWNQIARWVMRRPLSVQGEFVSLDTGTSSYTAGQAIEVECHLRAADGGPAEDKAITAVVRRSGQIVARVPLAKVPDMPGAYSAELEPLPEGEYQLQVEAPGYPLQALEVQTQFSVLAPESEEMLHLAQNSELMRQVATQTGGEYLEEVDAARLVELLQPMSSGRILHSATLLWQSYWWFSAAMLLLVIEWIVRKRVGLV